MDFGDGRDIADKELPHLASGADNPSNERHEKVGNQSQELEEIADDAKWVEEMLAEIAKVEEELNRIESLIPQAQDPVSSHHAQVSTGSTMEPPHDIDEAYKCLATLIEEHNSLIAQYKEHVEESQSMHQRREQMAKIRREIVQTLQEMHAYGHVPEHKLQEIQQTIDQLDKEHKEMDQRLDEAVREIEEIGGRLDQIHALKEVQIKYLEAQVPVSRELENSSAAAGASAITLGQ
ncbi:uncharacterized protein BDZ99DRAFT_480202 [Mytilinidion resinicola]|uniref:Uncharacterized protein n=1 Tax=Mytilinidion resinicola TaxID=574789 RepID=A0A6A6Y9I5_9PEZI|nr:uncharacterized protein BDZ99DRAFT_480202 [Mytilinidion resinicola]KAF2805482.1 hypothetical protein BDZ99DRAFT_480202 [Mytilinidion resinicola]